MSINMGQSDAVRCAGETDTELRSSIVLHLCRRCARFAPEGLRHVCQRPSRHRGAFHNTHWITFAVNASARVTMIVRIGGSGILGSPSSKLRHSSTCSSTADARAVWCDFRRPRSTSSPPTKPPQSVHHRPDPNHSRPLFQESQSPDRPHLSLQAWPPVTTWPRSSPPVSISRTRDSATRWVRDCSWRRSHWTLPKRPHCLLKTCR